MAVCDQDLPYKVILVLFLSQISEGCAHAAVFGYLPKLLNYFGKPWKEIGFYQGAIMTTYCIMLFFSSLVAGKIIDRYGTRGFFMACSLAQAGSLIFLGFTSNFTWLVIGTILLGATTGVETVTKVMAYEVSNDRTQPFIITYAIAMPFNVGMFFGPALSGILSFPTIQYPNIFSSASFLSKYPILIPNLLIGLVLLITVVLAKFTLQVKTEDDIYLEIDEIETSHSSNQEKTKFDVLQFMRKKDVMVTIFQVVIYCLATEGFMTAFSVWAQTPSEKGGLGYSPNNVGTLLLTAGALVIVGDSLIIGAAIEKLGYRCGLIVCLMVLSFATSLAWIPSRMKDKKMRFIFNLIVLVVSRVAISGEKVAMYGTINNVTPDSIRGRVMSGQQCLTTIFEALGHVMAGSLFAWSIQNFSPQSMPSSSLNIPVFPLNSSFVFYILSFIALLGAFAAVLYSDDIEKRPDELNT